MVMDINIYRDSSVMAGLLKVSLLGVSFLLVYKQRRGGKQGHTYFMGFAISYDLLEIQWQWRRWGTFSSVHLKDEVTPLLFFPLYESFKWDAPARSLWQSSGASYQVDTAFEHLLT